MKYFVSLVMFVSSITFAEPVTHRVNPDYIRAQLLENNISVLVGLNNVYQSKLRIGVARGNLLPSINLGGMLNSVGPSFVLASVSFLLPFLVPSNWFAYKESKYIYEAEKEAYYLLELNTLASAYATYVSILGDIALRGVLKTQYDNASLIQKVTESRAEFGLASESDVKQSRAGTQMAMVQLSQIEELIQKEKAEIRQILAIPLTDKFEFEGGNIVSSEFENQDIAAVAKEAINRSPEYKQVSLLKLAADQEKWAKVFAFLSDGSLSAQTGFGRAASFSSVQTGLNFNIGFGYFPQIQLAKAAIEQIKLRLREIELEQSSTVEATLNSLTQAQIQYEQSKEAETNLFKVFEIQMQNYKLGLTDYLHVLNVQTTIVEASTSRIRSQVDLNLLRLNLHRIMLSDQFSMVKPCKATQEKRGFFQRKFDFFRSKKGQIEVDKLCRTGRASEVKDDKEKGDKEEGDDTYL